MNGFNTFSKPSSIGDVLKDDELLQIFNQTPEKASQSLKTATKQANIANTQARNIRIVDNTRFKDESGNWRAIEGLIEFKDITRKNKKGESYSYATPFFTEFKDVYPDKHYHSRLAKVIDEYGYEDIRELADIARGRAKNPAHYFAKMIAIKKIEASIKRLAYKAKKAMKKSQLISDLKRAGLNLSLNDDYIHWFIKHWFSLPPFRRENIIESAGRAKVKNKRNYICRAVVMEY